MKEAAHIIDRISDMRQSDPVGSIQLAHSAMGRFGVSWDRLLLSEMSISYREMGNEIEAVQCLRAAYELKSSDEFGDSTCAFAYIEAVASVNGNEAQRIFLREIRTTYYWRNRLTLLFALRAVSSREPVLRPVNRYLIELSAGMGVSLRESLSDTVAEVQRQYFAKADLLENYISRIRCAENVGGMTRIAFELNEIIEEFPILLRNEARLVVNLFAYK